MAKFLAVYRAPIEGLEAWAKTDPQVRQAEEKKMQAEWGAWMAAHQESFSGPTAGIGKTKRVTKDGVVDTKNDLMLYSIVEAESHEAAAALFENHPHFGIPDGSIDVMPINYLSGMADMQ